MAKILSSKAGLAFDDLVLVEGTGDGEGNSVFRGRIVKGLTPEGLQALKDFDFYVEIGSSYFKGRVVAEGDDGVEIFGTLTAKPLW